MKLVKIPHSISKEYVMGLRDGLQIAKNVCKRSGYLIKFPRIIQEKK